MSTRNPNIVPGWKMTFAQKDFYFIMAGQWCRAKGLTLTSANRYAFHDMAGLGPVSVTVIDRLEGFDALKSEWLAVCDPTNIDAQLKLVNMTENRLRHRIMSLAPEAYWKEVAADKFGGRTDLDDLKKAELVQLRNTLCARKAHWPETMPAGGRVLEEEMNPF